MAGISRYLDAKTLTKIDKLSLKAKYVVEGFISGMHRSPYRGFSVEFAEHRGYVPGDDIKHIDWRVYGKSERYYIKQYEEDDNNSDGGRADGGQCEFGEIATQDEDDYRGP